MIRTGLLKMDLETIKTTIENFQQKHHIEILKIIRQSSTTINENKSGIYINLSFLKEETIEQIRQYIAYVQDQETLLKPLECQKESFKNTFFTEKEYKDDLLYNGNK